MKVKLVERVFADLSIKGGRPINRMSDFFGIIY